MGQLTRHGCVCLAMYVSRQLDDRCRTICFNQTNLPKVLPERSYRAQDPAGRILETRSVAPTSFPKPFTTNREVRGGEVDGVESSSIYGSSV